MKRITNKRHMTMDLDHMRLLQVEAIDQLDLMYTTLEAAEHATDTLRDKLDDISLNHWHAYMDVIHLICMHDQEMNNIIKKRENRLTEFQAETAELQISMNRVNLIFLILSLLRRHRRLESIYSIRGNAMQDYYKETLLMERQHIVTLITMIQSIL